MEIHHKYRLIIVILLLSIVAGSSIFLIVRYSQVTRPMEISLATHTNPITIDIRGEVVNPGFYQLYWGDCLSDAIDAAGGFTTHAAISNLPLSSFLEHNDYIFVPSVHNSPQRVNINTAEKWLLEALPGIGKTRADNIIAYRSINGPFQNIKEIINVPNIGEGIFSNIKDLITI